MAQGLRDRGRGREVVVEYLHVHLSRVLQMPASPHTANTKQETAR
ncbi:hypothetical protein RKD37_000133 [Streptomyces ambofaciens]